MGYEGVVESNKRRRKYTFDYRYFEKIDTEDRAYWLGFLYADASIRKNSVRLTLVTEGQEHLNRFAKSVNHSGEALGPYKRKYKYKGEVRFTTAYTLTLNHEDMVRDLSQHGVVPKKTFIVEFPDLREDLRRHFIRGVFDGDGCITTNTSRHRNRIYKTANMNFCGGAPKFLERIVEVISDEAGVVQKKVFQPKSGGAWRFIYEGTAVLKIRDWMYEGASVFMRCKHDKFFSWETGNITEKVQSI